MAALFSPRQIMERARWGVSGAQPLGRIPQFSCSQYHLQVALVVKNLPACAGDFKDVGSVPGSGDPLEKEMATRSSVPAWRIPWTEEPGGLQSMGSQRVGPDKNDSTYLMPFPGSFPSSTQAVAHLLPFPGYFKGVVALLFISTVKCICLHNSFLRIFHLEVG